MSTFPDISEDILRRWQQVVEILAEIAAVPTAIITKVHEPTIEILRANANPDSVYQEGVCVDLSGHYCEEVIRTYAPLRLRDAREQTRWQQAPELAHDMVSYFGYPIAWPSGDVFGTICILDQKPRDYDERSATLLEQFRDMVETHLALAHRNLQLQRSLEELRVLRGIIPICAQCKKIRDDEGFWQQVEQYISDHSEAIFSHGLCPDCMEKTMRSLPAD